MNTVSSSTNQTLYINKDDFSLVSSEFQIFRDKLIKRNMETQEPRVYTFKTECIDSPSLFERLSIVKHEKGNLAFFKSAVKATFAVAIIFGGLCLSLFLLYTFYETFLERYNTIGKFVDWKHYSNGVITNYNLLYTKWHFVEEIIFPVFLEAAMTYILTISPILISRELLNNDPLIRRVQELKRGVSVFTSFSKEETSTQGLEVDSICNQRDKESKKFLDPITFEEYSLEELMRPRFFSIGGYVLDLPLMLKLLIERKSEDGEIPHPIENRQLNPDEKEKFISDLATFLNIEKEQVESCWKSEVNLVSRINGIANRLYSNWSLRGADFQETARKLIEPTVVRNMRCEKLKKLLPQLIVEKYFREDLKEVNTYKMLSVPPLFTIEAADRALLARLNEILRQNNRVFF